MKGVSVPIVANSPVRFDLSGIVGICLGLLGMKGVGVPILRANSPLQVENWRAKKKQKMQNKIKVKSKKQKTILVGKLSL